MNTEDKKVLIVQLIEVLTAIANEEERKNTIITNESEREEKVEFLTIKQATEIVSGISEHTISQMIARNKIVHIRTGQGQRGKILINKASLLAYCNNNDCP